MELQRSYCAKWKFKSSDTYYQKRSHIMYEMLLEDLLEALENNGIDTSKLKIQEVTDEDDFF